MYKNLLHRTTPDVDIFYLLWSNVFSLGQLENVLFSINDLQSSILRETDNSISVLESCGWCQWRKWQSHRCLSSIFKADISRDLWTIFYGFGESGGKPLSARTRLYCISVWRVIMQPEKKSRVCMVASSTEDILQF